MHLTRSALPRWAMLLPLLLLAAPNAAHAQATMNADVGLGKYYKAQRWLPVQITLMNQGRPARVEVRAHFGQANEGLQEYRIPERTLPASANEIRTLCVKAPTHYAAQSMFVDLVSDGRVLNTVRGTPSLVNEGDWLAVGIGQADYLKLLGGATLGQAQLAPNARPWGGRSTKPTVNVGVMEPKGTPDRWQGLEAADLVVLSGVSERDFTPEQLQALRDYVIAGGTIAVTGGPNWNRLATPFFKDLLPVEVRGSRVTSRLPNFGGSAGAGPYGSFILTDAVPKNGTTLTTSDDHGLIVAEGAKGMGRVVFVAFDPTSPAMRSWPGATEFWKSVLTSNQHPSALQSLAVGETTDPNGNVYMNGQQGARLADVPYSIPQLDIPQFYIVAVFLLAYILCLVPINYFVLKARDKKEYAWITTPAIVLVFSLGAYMIGYGFKGGRTLLVKVGVIEARASQDSAPDVFYAGLFSPRKTGYDLQVASAEKGGIEPTLLSDPAASRTGNSLLVSQENDAQKINDFGVDMWAMRVVKGEGIVHLRNGVVGDLKGRGSKLTGKVTNDTPYTLQDCYITQGGTWLKLGDIAPGASAEPKVAPGNESIMQVPGSKVEQRMKRGVLTTVVGGGGGQVTGTTTEPVMIAWVKEPVGHVLVNGGEPREMTCTLMLVHLNTK